MLIVTAAIIVWSNITRRYNCGAIIFAICISLFSIPYLLFSNSETAVYLIFGAAIIALLLKSKICALMLSLFFIFVIGGMAFGYYKGHPDTSIAESFRLIFSQHFGGAWDVVVCGMALSLLNVFQTRAYQREKEKAEAASRAKSDYLSNMSHEIRAPINAVMGMTTIGKSAADKERKDYCFSRIDEASKHLLGVINNILDISKIEAGKMELAFEDFNFEEMLQTAVHVIQYKANEKRIKLSARIDKRIPAFLFGDEQRLAQVVTNLIGNAVKFTPEKGSVFLEAEYLGDKSEGQEIKISVRDTGIGITLQQQAILFASFQQAAADTSRKYGGTGLGLAISKNIIEMMGGNIWLESEMLKGSTFSFVVTLKEGKNPEHYTTHDIFQPENITALVCESDPLNMKYYTDILSNAGILCKKASSVEDVFRRIGQDTHYDIYFFDAEMPGFDSLDLAKFISPRWAASKTRAVLICAPHQWNDIEETARNAGIIRHLPQPVFPSTMIGMVTEILDSAQRDTVDNKNTITDQFEGYKLLLVDDVEINREIVIALLEPTRISIDCAVNGLEAVEKFTSGQDDYNLIFMDVNMPEMNGYEATQAIRALNTPQAKNIPIIAMTASVFRENITQCLEAGMNDHVGKPLDFNEVLDSLRRYLPASIPQQPWKKPDNTEKATKPSDPQFQHGFLAAKN